MHMSKFLLKKQDFYKKYNVFAWIKGFRNCGQEWRRLTVCNYVSTYFMDDS